jgi:hypothetical protein
LFALAYNLGNFLRRLVLPKSVKKWSLRTLREKLIKIGAKVVRHSRYIIFQMAEKVPNPANKIDELLPSEWKKLNTESGKDLGGHATEVIKVA